MHRVIGNGCQAVSDCSHATEKKDLCLVSVMEPSFPQGSLHPGRSLNRRRGSITSFQLGRLHSFSHISFSGKEQERLVDGKRKREEYRKKESNISSCYIM